MQGLSNARKFAQRQRSDDLSVVIADQIRTAILEGQLIEGERLPSEADLAASFGVSRPTVREALKRLAAQNLIRTRRGAAGGAFVRKLSFDDVRAQMQALTTLALSMNAVDFETACEARFALEAAAVPLAAKRHRPEHLARMQEEIERQEDPALSDEAFCASDVAFHVALVEAAGNPVLTFQLASAIEAMQPLMNMITYTQRKRALISSLHRKLHGALAIEDTGRALAVLNRLGSYTLELGTQIRDACASRRADESAKKA